jgi:prolyl oligopeptidase PreP (S9A serine peptidase family)
MATGDMTFPLTPRYEPLFGKLWMERGGVYVHAYLRGGLTDMLNFIEFPPGSTWTAEYGDPRDDVPRGRIYLFVASTRAEHMPVTRRAL